MDPRLTDLNDNAPLATIARWRLGRHQRHKQRRVPHRQHKLATASHASPVPYLLRAAAMTPSDMGYDRARNQALSDNLSLRLI
jgi:hypothetical protein